MSSWPFSIKQTIQFTSIPLVFCSCSLCTNRVSSVPFLLFNRRPHCLFCIQVRCTFTLRLVYKLHFACRTFTRALSYFAYSTFDHFCMCVYIIRAFLGMIEFSAQRCNVRKRKLYNYSNRFQNFWKYSRLQLYNKWFIFFAFLSCFQFRI